MQREAAIIEAQRLAASSGDYQEATRSFLEKRRPIFRGC